MPSALSFHRHGPSEIASPVVVSVPHAGRDYPLALRAALNVPLAALVGLEDRYVDHVALAAHGSATLFIQQHPRAWIDLNRDERERDPRVDEGASANGYSSAKLRSGLGLIPRRAAGVAEIWARRLPADEVAARIAADHRPYHRALAEALAAARARFGTAVLLDLHSMPPLAPPARARLVIGDRFGRAAGPRFVHRVEGEAEGAGLPHALNSPYAGGYILERHGAPARGVHAVQLELDRSLYLDARLDQPGPGLAATAALVQRVIAALEDEALGHEQLAAE